MQLVELTEFIEEDSHEPDRFIYHTLLVNPDGIGAVREALDPATDLCSHLILKGGQEYWVKETPTEIALLLGGKVKPTERVKRYRDRRATFARQREEAWKYFEKAHYALSLGTQGHVTEQQITTPCTAQSIVHLFVGDGPIFKVYGDFWDKDHVDHHCIACYSEKEHQLLVFDSDELCKYPANAEGAHFVDLRVLTYIDILEYGHADDVLGCCDGGRAREYCDPSHLAPFDDEGHIDPFA